jgi:hypothetical protein
MTDLNDDNLVRPLIADLGEIEARRLISDLSRPDVVACYREACGDLLPDSIVAVWPTLSLRERIAAILVARHLTSVIPDSNDE